MGGDRRQIWPVLKNGALSGVCRRNPQPSVGPSRKKISAPEMPKTARRPPTYLMVTDRLRSGRGSHRRFTAFAANGLMTTFPMWKRPGPDVNRFSPGSPGEDKWATLRDNA